MLTTNNVKTTQQNVKKNIKMKTKYEINTKL